MEFNFKVKSQFIFILRYHNMNFHSINLASQNFGFKEFLKYFIIVSRMY